MSLALAALALLALALPLYQAFAAFRVEHAVFVPQRHAPRLSLAEFGVEGARAVSFPSRAGSTLRGYFAPPQNGAVVVLCHGSQSERSDLVDEARILAGAGFGILAFDWPGHGESDGGIIWGEPERQALEGALDFASKQPGVDPARLGAFGFSMGGYTVAQVAAADPRIAATVLASSPHDALEHTNWEYRQSFARRQGALLAIRMSGMPLDEAIPVRVVGKISPRPLLVLAGAVDEGVPRWISERLFNAAAEPKRLVIVPGAGHGGYLAADPDGYPRALLDFFSVLSGAKATSSAGTPSP